MKKRVLVTGVNSYIGNAFRSYMEQYPEEAAVEGISVRNDVWKTLDFSGYDCIFDVAGIAHADTGHVSEEVKKRYYAVNCDLTVALAQKAKEEGVRQFIFMSSAIVYGDSAPIGFQRMITRDTLSYFRVTGNPSRRCDKEYRWRWNLPGDDSTSPEPAPADARKAPAGYGDKLLTNAELFDDGGIPFQIEPLEVIEKAPPIGNHLKKAAPCGEVLFVGFHVLGQSVDLLGKEGNLNFRTAGVFVAALKFGNDRLFFFFCHDRHLITSLCCDCSPRAGRV